MMETSPARLLRSSEYKGRLFHAVIPAALELKVSGA